MGPLAPPATPRWPTRTLPPTLPAKPASGGQQARLCEAPTRCRWPLLPARACWQCRLAAFHSALQAWGAETQARCRLPRRARVAACSLPRKQRARSKGRRGRVRWPRAMEKSCPRPQLLFRPWPARQSTRGWTGDMRMHPGGMRCARTALRSLMHRPWMAALAVAARQARLLALLAACVQWQTWMLPVYALAAVAQVQARLPPAAQAAGGCGAGI